MLDGAEAWQTDVTMRKILAILTSALIGLLAVHAWADSDEFCLGFEHGYTAGFKRAKKTNIDPFVPICPIQPIKYWGDPESDFEHGFVIGYERGKAEASR